MDSNTARILHLQRYSTEDGPGIRTTLFFKGCPLACTWCHNPESISPHPQVQWLESRCIECGTCLEACPQGCLSRDAAGAIHIDRSCCTGCGACVAACPANALELLGQTVTLEALVTEVLKDRAYFETSSGGVTLSGGEPTLQAPFAAAFLQRLRAEDIHTALDTCGAVSQATLEALLPHVALVLYDFKEIDPEKHRAFTGQSNARILENARFIRRAIAEHHLGTRLWIRTPLIPGATATPENLAGLGAFIATALDGAVDRWELCAFNNLCRDKYRRLGMPWVFADAPLMTAEALAEAEQWARASGVAPEIVVATGAVQKAL